MKDKLKTLADYVLIGVIGFLPILLVFQIIVYVERALREFVLLVHGRYENSLTTVVLFAAAIALLAYFGRQLKHDKAHLYNYLDALIQRIPLIGSIYRVARKLLGLFLSGDGDEAREIVYVEYPKDDMWVPAYVTNKFGDCYVL